MPRFDRLSLWLGAAASLAGAAALIHYLGAGLTLAHYDAKAHLVVARRIFDSLTPTWDQIGAVWLPLPHVLNMLPVQIDAFYRTGASAIALSLVSLGITASALAAIVMRLTGSRSGAALGVVLLVWNPSVLYLHATPMTEPLLFATTMMSTWLAVRWVTEDGLHVSRAFGWWMVAACLTRYEAWPITGAIVPLALLARWRRGTPWRDLVGPAWQMARYPIGAALFFFCLSRATVGEWFVSGGFYVPDPELQGHPDVVWEKIAEGVRELSTSRFVRAAAISGGLLAVVAAVWRQKTTLLVPLAMAAAVALPFSAFLSGHPFRIRYQIPLVVAAALAIGVATGLTRRFAPIVAIALAALILPGIRPLDPEAPMVVEAQRDRPNGIARGAVTACLARDYRGEIIFASMGSLAHYMQELSHIGLNIRDFLHEGNHPMWDDAIVHGGAPYAGWMLVEEVAEGGDVIAERIRANPSFAAGYERVCEGG
ncbi:MAG: hypothetical protein IT178_11475, partial [Acidobacteria bacterium]|nr:hypothetical protein [Acidobacteriota bacterium]